MTKYLLDVNALIALIDPAHVQHDEVHGWFSRTGRRSFATCPIAENGLQRIVGHPKYPNSPGPPSTAAGALVALRGLPGHMFWADSISLLDPDLVDASLLSNHSRVTTAICWRWRVPTAVSWPRLIANWPLRLSPTAGRW